MKAVIALAVLLAVVKAEDEEDEAIYVKTYAGSLGSEYNPDNFEAASTSTYAINKQPESVAAHPSYSIQLSDGDLLQCGDGLGGGRGWAGLYDKNANPKWFWQSNSSSFDAILGCAELDDGTIILGGTRSVSGRYEFLLVSLNPSSGAENWDSTFSLSSPNPPRSAGWATIYWVDVDKSKDLLIIGGVVDHAGPSDAMIWKSGGQQPDAGGTPFCAAIPFANLTSAPTSLSISTVHYFDASPGYSTVVSLRAEPGQGVICLLPINKKGGAISRLTYSSDEEFVEEWVKTLAVNEEVTDIAIIGDSSNRTGYVVVTTVNPGGDIEARDRDGDALWVKRYDVKDRYPAPSTNSGYWCQECWSIWTDNQKILVSCGVAILYGGDRNCDNGLWRSLIITTTFANPDQSAFSLWHSNPDENFAVEYASYGSDGEIICAIDADSGGSIVRIDSNAIVGESSTVTTTTTTVGTSDYGMIRELVILLLLVL